MRTIARGLVTAALLAAATMPAWAGEEELQQEVRALRERVRQLEERLGDGPASTGEIEKAVASYLESRPGMAGLNVRAPHVDGLEFSGQVRFWGERWNEVYRPADPLGVDIQDIFWLRTSLQADFEIAEGLRSRVEIRDARALGAEPSTVAQLNAAGAGLDLKQGWFQADDFLGSTTDVTMGRQVWSFGDQRVIGALDWATFGRSFDGVLMQRKFKETKASLFGARLFEGGNAPVVRGVENDDADLYGIYTETAEAIHHSDLDAYVLYLRAPLDLPGEVAGTSGNTGFFHFGTRLAGSKDNMDWGLEGGYQMGHVAGDRLRAWGIHARAGYTMADTKWTPRIGFEFNHATGDDNPADGDVGSFQTLFPTNHMHYGHMDVMAWQNMRHYAAHVSVKPSTDWKVTASYHRFYLDEEEDAWYSASGAPIRAGAASASNFVGQEIDLTFQYTVSEHMVIDLGGAQFLGGSFVKDTGGGGDALWMYFRVTVNF